MKYAVYISILLYFIRKMVCRLLPVDSGAPWEVLWLLNDTGTPSPKDRYIKVYEGTSPIVAWWAREKMVRQDWNPEYIFVLRKGQERDIRILDLEADFSEIYDLVSDECVDELRDIAREARAR